MKKSVLIVDIEWDPDSPMESPSVLQLAAVKINHNNDEGDTFFSFIKPRFEIPDISKILTIMPITSGDIFSGKDITIVLSEFIKWCGPECSFVLWGSYNLNIFSRIMEEYITVNQDHTIDLQQVYSILSDSNYLNLEKACINSGIKVFYPLHHSRNDARSLTELYKTLAQKYDLEDVIQRHLNDKAERRSEKRKEKRKQQSQKKVMHLYQYILDLCSGVVHQKRCPTLQAGLPQSKDLIR